VYKALVYRTIQCTFSWCLGRIVSLLLAVSEAEAKVGSYMGHRLTFKCV